MATKRSSELPASEQQAGRYGDQAIERVSTNPYVLAKDTYGIGFKTAHQIAQNLGIPKNSLNRACAGIDHVLLEATSDGHCALPVEKLQVAAVRLLEIDEGTVESALSQMLTSGALVHERIGSESLIFLPHLRKAEEGIAARIRVLTAGPPRHPSIDFEKAVGWCETRTGKELAPSQREALKTALANKVVVITGGPGVGKTTLVSSLSPPQRVGPPSASRKPPGWKQRRSTVSWRLSRQRDDSPGTSSLLRRDGDFATSGRYPESSQ